MREKLLLLSNFFLSWELETIIQTPTMTPSDNDPLEPPDLSSMHIDTSSTQTPQQPPLAPLV